MMRLFLLIIFFANILIALVLVLTFDHKASYEPRDYHKIYYLYRKDVPEKLINVKYVKMFGDTIQGHIPKEEIDWEEKIRKYRKLLKINRNEKTSE